MSQSPELPDLDREVLRTHARRVFEQRHDVDDEAMDELIAYVRTALARRAQPEGEAPQADKLIADKTRALSRKFYGEGIKSNLEIANLWVYTREVDAAPAAQHADSGAQVADFQSWFDGWVNPRLRALNRSIREHTAREAWNAALAAQSQGAQAADLDAGIAAIGEMCRSISDDEDPQYIVLQSAMKKLRNLKRAQQAAAPGALDPNVFFDALSDFKDSRMTVDDGQEFFDKLAASPSAPGTPEAPAGAVEAFRLYEAVNNMMAHLGMHGEISARSDMAEAVMTELHRLDGGRVAQRVEDLMEKASMPRDQATRLAVGEYCAIAGDAARAAQLDGGQGEVK